MNRKSLIAGLFIAAAATAVSAESYTEYNTPIVSSASRADDRGRGQVQFEYFEHREAVSAFTGEDSGSGYLNGRAAAAGETFTSDAGTASIVR